MQLHLKFREVQNLCNGVIVNFLVVTYKLSPNLSVSEMAPTFDPSLMDDQRSPSPQGRHRSVSPTEGNRVETIPEDRIPAQPPAGGSPQSSPRGEEQERDQQAVNSGMFSFHCIVQLYIFWSFMPSQERQYNITVCINSKVSVT